MFGTRKGLIKKTELTAYNTPIRADGIIAIKLRDGDQLVAVRGTSGEDDIIMVVAVAATRRASTSRGCGRWAATPRGVRGMNVSEKGNAVLAMDVARDDTELFVVTENGFGKRTPIADYPVKGRGTKGVKTIQMTDRKGALAGALIVREHQELVFISQSGMVQRTSVRGISRMGRSTQGVKVMNLRGDDTRQRGGARGRERGRRSAPTWRRTARRGASWTASMPTVDGAASPTATSPDANGSDGLAGQTAACRS